MESSNKWYEKVPVQKEGENAMSEAMLALLGFATIIIVIALLLRNVTVPALAFVSVSTVTGAILVATGTFTIEEMGEFVTAGVAGVHGTAALFIFSVLFFGIMTDVGMFDKIINALMKKVGSNVVGVAMMTCIIAMIGHLDGGGASTFLITIPAMLPVYKRLNMRPTTLMLICVSAMGVMNLLPWGGPTMRAATVLGIEPNALWKQIIPMQVVGIFIALGTAFIWGNIEKKRGAGTSSAEKIEYGGIEDEAVTDDEKNELARPKLFVFNVIVTLVVIVNLVLAKVPSYYIFMVGCAVALFVNYPGAKMQGKIIKSHAGPALTMASTILCAGVFLGVMQQTEIMTHMVFCFISEQQLITCEKRVSQITHLSDLTYSFLTFVSFLMCFPTFVLFFLYHIPVHRYWQYHRFSVSSRHPLPENLQFPLLTSLFAIFL